MAIWTIRAERQLQHSLARQLCQHPHGEDGIADCLQPISQTMERLNEILKKTFPDAQNIVVLDELAGFRRKHDIHTLLVEVSQDQNGGRMSSRSAQRPSSSWKSRAGTVAAQWA